MLTEKDAQGCEQQVGDITGHLRGRMAYAAILRILKLIVREMTEDINLERLVWYSNTIRSKRRL